MKDLLGLMGKAKEMQAKFQGMQEELATIEASGQAGGGLVNVTLSGKFEMKSLKIDSSLFKEDEVEILEDLILAAHNDAKAKVEAVMQEKTRELTAGLPIPPGEPAINPKPREMMTSAIHQLAGRFDVPSDVVLEIAIVDGETIANAKFTYS